MTDRFLPKHGGYKNLISYQRSEIIFDATIYFTKKYLFRGDRTIDQMIQAARSGKQNIAEASMAAGTSKEMEIKLTNVARASLEELLIDYRDFLRTRNLQEWKKNSPYVLRLQQLLRVENANYDTFRKGIEHSDPEICVNVIIGLIKVANFLLRKQIQRLESDFLKHGGLREQMTRARLAIRSKQ